MPAYLCIAVCGVSVLWMTHTATATTHITFRLLLLRPPTSHSAHCYCDHPHHIQVIATATTNITFRSLLLRPQTSHSGHCYCYQPHHIQIVAALTARNS
ncbi:hypothetical protein LSAT2_010687 [Lamellibrachia satsuma]|nr:hypothetical protein LSAT2_010687 [Lamellibrachia satsuma]